MKSTRKAARLLEKMGQIRRMERGKVCKMKGRNHFNHQTWHNGRNVVRYVEHDKVDQLQADINSYKRFMTLVEQYIDEIIRTTRQENAKKSPKPSKNT